MVTEKSLSSQQKAPTRTPQATARLAWRILTAASVCFLLLCALVGYGLWRFRASIMGPRTGSTLRAETNSVSQIHAGEVQAIAIPRQQPIPLREGETVQVGAGSPAGVNAYVTLWDGSTLQLFADTRITFTRLHSTLYSPASKDILLDMPAGQMLVGAALPGEYQQVDFAVRISDQVLITLEPGGSYLVRAGKRNEVAVRRGQAYVAIEQASPIVVDRGQKASLQPRGVLVEPARWQLAQNGDFAQGLTGWNPRLVTADDRNAVPATISVQEQRSAEFTGWMIELEHEGTEDLAQAILSQEINEDVDPYRSLLLQFDLQIREASLAGGGETGQIYPLNVRIRYRDAEGKDRTYIYAFYDHTAPGFKTEFPTRGEGKTTLVPHYRWWPVSLELTDDLKPLFLTGIDLFSSGNYYRVWVANISLTASLIAE